MPNLVLSLRQGEMLIINGAPIRFRTNATIELTAHARFLFGKQIMAPAEVNSPARRIYFALQTAYIGTDAERAVALQTAFDLIAQFNQATTSSEVREILDEALVCAEENRCYEAIKLAKRIIRYEEDVLMLPDRFASSRSGLVERDRQAVSA